MEMARIEKAFETMMETLHQFLNSLTKDNFRELNRSKMKLITSIGNIKKRPLEAVLSTP